MLFSDRARLALQQANKEAFRLNHEYIGTEHILLGVVQEGSCGTPGMLTKVGHDLGSLRTMVEKFVGTGSRDATVIKLSRTTKAEEALAYADEEARKCGLACVNTAHLLLGLLREPNTVAYRVLVGIGLDADELREEVKNISQDSNQ